MYTTEDANTGRLYEQTVAHYGKIEARSQLHLVAVCFTKLPCLARYVGMGLIGDLPNYFPPLHGHTLVIPLRD